MPWTATYRFGETSLVLECADETWIRYLERRFHAFRAEASKTSFFVRFDCTSASIPEGMSSPLSTYLETPEIEPRPHGFRVRTRTVEAEVDLETRRAYLRGPRALYPLDNLLRYLLPALDEQGAVLHGAALEGFVACGPSGAGKSTLARLVGDRALCDELCAVRRGGDGRFRVTSLPFWQARPASSTLTALLFLCHGAEHRLEPLDPSEAFRRLTTQILWPVELGGAMESLLAQTTELVEAVPAFELAFTPSDDVWGYIEEHVSP